MNDDDLLELATSALREEPADPPVDPMLTLRRIQSSVAQKNRRVRRMRTFLLPIAATLATSTAFAAATGKLTPVFRAVETAIFPSTTRELPVTPPPSPAAPKAKAAAPPAAPAPPPPVDEVPPPPAVEPAPPAPAAAAPPVVHAPRVAKSVAAQTPSTPSPIEKELAKLAGKEPVKPSADESVKSIPAPAPAQEKETVEGHVSGRAGMDARGAVEPPSAPLDPADDLYLRAHQLHFGKADPASTLASWDAYLQAAPNGRFAPEARFNRALVLVKMNRRDEAAAALIPFANGTYGTYRRNEARALLDILRTPH
ncbi:hypothetical protein LZC95_45145 [Pendulispora brunnea]|uniref:Uncharacterized protein n=1 Tax=Pendulispora brunnea TaxID=2905690 RepID=A0ABZ2K4L7_9BACT